MFGLKKKAKTTINAEILFHKECNGHVEHGKLAATHATLNVGKNDGVRFSFVGIEPPMLSAEVLNYITDQAERKGFIVSHLHSYCNVATQFAPPVLRPRTDQPRPVLEADSVPNDREALRSLRRPAGNRASTH